MGDSAPKFSFGFSKSKAPKKLISAAKLSEDNEQTDEKLDYLISFEDRAPQSIVKQEKEEFVIPMTFSRNNIRMQLKQKYQQVEAVDALTAEAIKALASGDSVEIAPSHIDETDVIVGLPSKNTPDYVDDAADADYDQIPIEKFGLALLKGMGLKDEEIKGPSSEDYASKVRLKGLGLGADPKVLLKSRAESKVPVVNSNEKLMWKEGTKCQVVYGRNDGQYGVIQGVDGDIGRIVVKLSATKQVLKIMQAALRLVSTAEYEKFANYLNQSDVKRYKVAEAQNGSNHHYEDDAGINEKRRRLEEPLKEEPRQESSRRSSTWLQRGLLVRYLDKESKYYLQKVKVLSVSLPSSSRSCRCSCETETGRTLKDIRERDLQTTIPKRGGQRVVVVRGDYLDEVADLVERDEKAAKAYVTLHSNGRKLLMSFDDVCAFE